jgi:hypothetical protein
MVGTLGMAGSLFSHDAVSTPGSNLVAKVSATDEGRAAIETILDQARADVRELLAANQSIVIALRDALLASDELIGQEILDVIVAAPSLSESESRGSERLGAAV